MGGQRHSATMAMCADMDHCRLCDFRRCCFHWKIASFDLFRANGSKADFLTVERVKTMADAGSGTPSKAEMKIHSINLCFFKYWDRKKRRSILITKTFWNIIETTPDFELVEWVKLIWFQLSGYLRKQIYFYCICEKFQAHVIIYLNFRVYFINVFHQDIRLKNIQFAELKFTWRVQSLHYIFQSLQWCKQHCACSMFLEVFYVLSKKRNFCWNS